MKTRLKHMTAALLTLIMVIGMVPLNAFAWGTEGEVCSSKFGSAYVGYDGGKYYSASKIDFIAYDSNGNISKHTKAGGNARRKFTLPMPPARSIRYIALSPESISHPQTTDTPLPAAATADIFRTCRKLHARALCLQRYTVGRRG